jgi:hypothetical protein
MKSKHMVGVYIKYWLAYCISIDVQMIYTLSLAHATLSTATSHKYTHLSDVSPENTSAGSTDSRLSVRITQLWGEEGGHSQAHSGGHRSAFACASVRAHV